jgi:hypothetical protein
MANTKWIQKATAKSHGQFAAKARKRGLSTSEFASRVKANPSWYDLHTKRQANLARTLGKLRKRG